MAWAVIGNPSRVTSLGAVINVIGEGGLARKIILRSEIF